MFLSILIPVFNAENHIVNCLQSIFEQDLAESHYEVILINDGSTDQSKYIITEFIKNKSNIIFIDQINQGNAKTRNQLFNLAKGDYVYCLDADDYLVPKTLKYVLKFAINNTMDFVGFKSRKTIISNEENNDKGHKNYNATIYSGIDYLTDNPLPNVEVWWFLVKRELLNEYEIRLDHIIMADVVFTYKLVLRSKRMCILPIHVHWYFQSPISVMRTKGSIAKHKLRLADNTYDMALGLNDLIEELHEYDLSENLRLKKDLILKRDYYCFFMIIRFLRFENKKQKIKDKIHVLEQKKMYPFVNHVRIHKCPYFLEKLINSVLNNKNMVFMLIKVFAIFKIKSNQV